MSLETEAPPVSTSPGEGTQRPPFKPGHRHYLKPQKKFYRQRAHSNPMSDHLIDYPRTPAVMDWGSLYPAFFNNPKDKTKQVEFADLGCGYGGLLVALSPMFPDTLILGMELRVKVSDFVIDKIKNLRSEHPDQYQNIACIRSNVMKYFPCYFKKAQLSKMFFLYPDPHFKRNKHRWRVINRGTLAEYAYALKEGGIVYTITDIPMLHSWIDSHFTEHPLFQKLTEEELKADPVVEKIYASTEEGQKVSRTNGLKLMACYRRVPDPFK
ncbi:unnamed protein product [Bemisia tabaci]|uniref:tRNA (guanine-N(7)-)-methyltransferase n=1 Tax=Bemisia tabaci TaxID=7038 RepID=A0A9P0EY88_BEMTA|nr:unnamed protein product [Bemisia tabaci]